MEPNEIPEMHCWSCEDYGDIPIFHVSTDALLYYVKCQRIHGHVWKELPRWKSSEAEIAAEKAKPDYCPF